MLYLVWAISIVASFYLGYKFGDLTKKVEAVQEILKEKIDKPKEEPNSQLIDVLDPVQSARYEHEQMLKKMNPDG